MFNTEAFIDGYVEAALWADAFPLDPVVTDLENGKWKVTIKDETFEFDNQEDAVKEATSLRDNMETGGLNETHEIDAAGLEKMTPDCERFIKENEADLLLYVEQIQDTIDNYDGNDDRRPESWAGHDFWLTRGGHGTGFWDRGLGELGERLSEAARKYGEPDDHRPYAISDDTATA